MKKLVIAILAVFIQLAVFGEELGIAPGTDFKAILNKPTVISSKTTTQAEDGKTWIYMLVDAHVIADVSVDAVFRFVTDFASYPKYFKRTISTVRSGSNENCPIFDVTAGATILGFNFLNKYKTQAVINIDTPDTKQCEIIDLENDGTIKNVSGIWFIKTVSYDGKPYTYIRFKDSSLMLQKVAGQKAVIAGASEKEHRDAINIVIAGAAGK